MNGSQKRVLLVAACVVVLMLLFPPFHFTTAYGVEFNLGYSFLLSPPLNGNYQPGSVNIGMLLTQWVGVCAVTALAAYLLKE